MSISRVLLVEDSADDEELSLRALSGCDVPVDVQVARDGAEALRALGLDAPDEGDPAPLPDLIILDGKMPLLDGFEVLARLRAAPRARLVRVVFFSSSRSDADIERAYRLGASSYVRKPLEFDRYERVVRDIAEYWLGHSESPYREAGR